MKYLFLLFSSLSTFAGLAQKNYMVQLGDSIYNVSLDSTYQITVQGKKLGLSLRQKNLLTYQDTLFSFSYLPEFQVSKTSIDSTVDQYMVLTADGTGFLLQAFRTLNPTGLNE